MLGAFFFTLRATFFLPFIFFPALLLVGARRAGIKSSKNGTAVPFKVREATTFALISLLIGFIPSTVLFRLAVTAQSALMELDLVSLFIYLLYIVVIPFSIYYAIILLSVYGLLWAYKFDVTRKQFYTLAKYILLLPVYFLLAGIFIAEIFNFIMVPFLKLFIDLPFV